MLKAVCQPVAQVAPPEALLALPRVQQDESGLQQAQSLPALRASPLAAPRRVPERVLWVRRELSTQALTGPLAWRPLAEPQLRALPVSLLGVGRLLGEA